ncbi:hypothetical protein [Nafulsella turpanensis]|uniref:hypothetical protein n=1 Tax=Nafulsella turpanensis TaxID=1265690 RepID=UPI000344F4E4|nr:hypothetical protein [Nafulsella turpanensis]
MKKASHLLSVLFLMALVIFTSCKDDTVEETPLEENTRILTAGPFEVSTVALDPAVDYNFTGTSTLTFSENGTYTITGGDALPMVLSTGASIPASGEWSFTDTENFNEITLVNGSESVELTVTSLTDNEIVFSYAGAEPKPTDEVEVTVTATR